MPNVAKLLIPSAYLNILHLPETKLKASEILFFILGVLLYFCCFILAGMSTKPHYLPIAIRLLILFLATDLYNSYILNRFLYTHTALISHLYWHYHHQNIDRVIINKQTENHLLTKILLGIPGCLFLAFILYIT